MNEQIINALQDREAMCMRILTNPQTPKEKINMVYVEMVKAAHERKLLQTSIAKN